MDSLDHTIKQLQACTQELAEGNDKAEERERLQRLANRRALLLRPSVLSDVLGFWRLIKQHKINLALF